MNPTSLADAKELATVVAAETADMPGEAIIFPPRGARVPGARPRPPAHSTRRFPFIGAVSEIIKDTKLHLGAHERRSLFMDDDTAVNKKTLKVLESGMIPVLCIGETKDEYDAGLCESVCAIQLAKDLAGVSAEDMKKIVIAYEPVPRRVRRPGAFLRAAGVRRRPPQVWAIGTGLVCPSDKAQEVHKFIRSKLASMYDEATADAVRIQYGGSVTPDSVDELMSMPDIDGCLRPRRPRRARARSLRPC
ncbi:triosephosphate isomerase [Aureococcus anophagefferens]|nr:triosephosphate isomerase [Aureococcus anophagefferens]